MDKAKKTSMIFCSGRFIKTLAAVLCLAVFLLIFPADVSAADIERIAVLGDSISKGYGLAEDEKNYGMWLGEYFGANVSNHAVSGKTTQELIDQLDTDSDAIEAVKEADLICVSIGGNDLLDFIFDDLFSAAKNYTSSSGGITGLSPESVENIIISISTAIGPASVKAGENTVIIADKLAELNPHAKLVFQTVYNPFESNNPDFKDMLPPLYTFASIYLASINRPVSSNERIICADIKRKFKGLCPYLTNMNELDIHPNKTGHIVIAEEIVQKLRLPGNYDIFRNAFDDMTEGTLSDIPQELKEEIFLLSDGVFRKETVPTETTAKLTLKKTTTASSKIKEITSETAKSPAEEETEPESSFNIAIIIDAAAAALLIAVIIFAAAKHRKKQKERRNQK